MNMVWKFHRIKHENIYTARCQLPENQPPTTGHYPLSTENDMSSILYGVGA